MRRLACRYCLGVVRQLAMDRPELVAALVVIDGLPAVKLLPLVTPPPRPAQAAARVASLGGLGERIVSEGTSDVLSAKAWVRG